MEGMNGVQGVGSSNLLAPTKKQYIKKSGLAKCLIRFYFIHKLCYRIYEIVY